MAGKSKFHTFDRGDAIDHADLPETGGRWDPQTAAAAAELIAEHAPQVMLLHFASVDGVGHAEGWGTPVQLDAIEYADASLKTVLDMLKKQGLFEQTLIIVTADHGGFQKTHHGDDPRGRHIPWIIRGPGVLPNFDLTLVPDLEVETYDTFATACAYLGFPLPERNECQVIRAAFKEPDTTFAPIQP